MNNTSHSLADILDSRASNFELLRIICMLMIVGLHLFGKGGALEKLTPMDINYYFVNISECLLIVAVNCFVLMSGYFEIKFNTRKILALHHQVLFYSIVIAFVFYFYGDYYQYTSENVIKSLFPVIFNQWWFVSIYIALYFFSPFFNSSLMSLSKIEYQKILACSFLVFCVLPTFKVGLVNNSNGYSLYSFMFLYAIGNYIRKYGGKTSKTNMKFLYGYLVCSVLTFLSNLFLTRLIGHNVLHFLGYDKIFTFVGSVCLFLFFKSLTIKSTSINYIASLVFSVYIIHEHPAVRAYIWQGLFHCDTWIYSSYYPIYSIGIIIIIFAVCLFVEYLRKLLFFNLEKVMVFREEKAITAFFSFMKRKAGLIS